MDRKVEGVYDNERIAESHLLPLESRGGIGGCPQSLDQIWQKSFRPALAKPKSKTGQLGQPLPALWRDS